MEGRLKRVRESSDLTMADFGARIGITGASVSRLESGDRSPADRTVKLICATYNVSEHWLRTGDGEMFELTDGTLLDELCREHDLDATEKAILAEFLDLPHEYRMIAKKIILGMADRIRKADDPYGNYITEADLDEIIARGLPEEKAE